MPRFTIKSFSDMRPSDFVKMNEYEMKEMLIKARDKFDARQRSFYSTRNKNVFSPALETAESYYEDVPRKNVYKMNRNQAMSELFKLQDFFKSKTSSVAEARKENREQDIRIYGKNKLGRPVKRMTIEERTEFWHAYEEYNRTYKPDLYVFGSNRIQQVLGDMVRAEKNGVHVDANFLERMREKISSRETGVSYGPNIFSGRGND